MNTDKLTIVLILQAANFVMFMGSAHSKFENNMPAGYEGCLKHLPPLTFEEYKCYLKGENTVRLNLPSKMRSNYFSL